MFAYNQDIVAKKFGEGVTHKVLAYSEKLMLCELKLKKGAILAQHYHPHEQCTYIVSGKVRFTVGDETKEADAGDTVLMPGNVSHGTMALEDSIIVDAFCPAREDFI